MGGKSTSSLSVSTDPDKTLLVASIHLWNLDRGPQ